MRITIVPDLAYIREEGRGGTGPKHVIYQMYYSIDPPKSDQFEKIITKQQRASRTECKKLQGNWIENKGCKVSRFL